MKFAARHIILIVIFLLIPILSSPDLDRNFSMLRVPMFQREMLQMVFLVGFFYLNYLVLIRKFYNRKKYVLYGLIVLGSYFFIATVPQVLIKDNKSPQPLSFSQNPPPPRAENSAQINPPPPPQNRESQAPRIFRKTYMRSDFAMTIFRALVPFSFTFLASFFWYKNNEQRELERAKAKAELLNLKYQLEPHFLFNILNAIYSLSLMKSDDAPEGILKLSSVMRYVVQESGQDQVALKKELQYLKDYIALQLIRTDNSLDFSYTEIGEPKNYAIAPLILVNFIENAFKYGFNAEENSKIAIEISVENEKLHLKTFNRIVKKEIKEESLGVGLNNTLERLKQMYPNQHTIEIKNDGKTFDVDLVIELSTLQNTAV